MPTPEENPVVAYTIKELFEEIKRSIESISMKLDSKADKSEVESLARDLVQFREELNELHRMIDAYASNHSAQTKAKASLDGWKQWSIIAILTVALLILGILQYFK